MMDKPLIPHFEPFLLSSQDTDGTRLDFLVSYEAKSFAKTGIQALLAKTPLGDDKPVAMDLDVGCGLYDELGRLIDTVWFGNKRAINDLVRHHGDTFVGMNKTYRPDRAEETLSVRFYRHQDFAKVCRVAWFVHSYHRHALNQTVGDVVLVAGETPLCQMPLAGVDDGVFALCAWQMVRCDDDWQVLAPMKAITAKNAGEMAQQWQNLGFV